MATAFTIYLLLGPLAWLGMSVLAFFARERLKRFETARLVAPDVWPAVRILIPAKDEAEAIAGCVRRALAQDYPNATVCAIDDRSTDGTGAILDALARENPRLDVRHVAELPAGWLGKCHALFVGTRDVGEPWLLFVDSDVQLAPDAARRTVALCVDRKYDALSLLPRLDARSFWERALLPLLAMLWGATFKISLTNEDSRPNVAFANGQFFLIRRDAYERVDGHAGVRDQIVEDVALMRRLKSGGARVRFLLGSDAATARMHTNLRQMFNGWARIFAGSSGRSIWPIVGAIAWLVGTIVLLCVGIGFSIATAHPAWIIATIAHAAFALGYTIWAYRAAGQPVAYALLWPVTLPMTLAVLAFAVRVCRTGTVAWRGNVVGVNRGRI